MEVKTEFGLSICLLKNSKKALENTFFAAAQVAKMDFCEECLHPMEKTGVEDGYIVYKCLKCGYIYKEK